MFASSLLLDIKSNDSIATAFNEFRAKSSLSKVSLNYEGMRSNSREQLKPHKSGLDVNFELTQLSKNNKYLEEKVIGTMLSIKKLKNISKNLKLKEQEIESLEKEAQKSDEMLNKKRLKLNWIEDTLCSLYSHCINNDDEGVSRLFKLSKMQNLKIRSPRKSVSIEDFALKSISNKTGPKTTKNSNLKSPYDSNAKILTISSKRVKKNSKLTTRVQAFTPSIKIKRVEKVELGENFGGKLDRLLKRTKNIIELLRSNNINNT